MNEHRKLVARDAAQNDQLGWSVAISSRLTAAGAFWDENTRGAVYVFRQSDGAWVEEAKLVPEDAVSGTPNSMGSYFGNSVAITENTIVGGAPGGGGAGRGKAWIFERSGNNWIEVAKLKSSQPSPFDDFGFAVAISDDTVLVGAIGDDDACGGGGGVCNSGGAYVFVRSGGVWTEQQRLTASDAEEGARFGWSVAMQGDRAVIGAPGSGEWMDVENGSAYVFERTGSVWIEQAKLEASDGDGADLFGWSVGLDGDTVVVGAPADEDAGVNAGSAYVFKRNGSAWTQTQKILSNGTKLAGFAISLSGGMAVVGEQYTARVFDASGAALEEQARLRPSEASYTFGLSVGVHAARVVVGAYADDSGCPGVAGCNTGAAFVFDVRTPGSIYCSPAQPNSTGTDGEMRVFGSGFAAEDSLTLSAVDLPTDPNVGYFLMGTGMTMTTPPGSAGPICVAPGVKRYLPVASTSEHPGGFSRTVGTSGAVSRYITPGSTWNFQAWYRDASAGSSNLTDAVSVAFQ